MWYPLPSHIVTSWGFDQSWTYAAVFALAKTWGLVSMWTIVLVVWHQVLINHLVCCLCKPASGCHTRKLEEFLLSRVTTMVPFFRIRRISAHCPERKHICATRIWISPTSMGSCVSVVANNQALSSWMPPQFQSAKNCCQGKISLIRRPRNTCVEQGRYHYHLCCRIPFLCFELVDTDCTLFCTLHADTSRWAV